MHLSQAQQDLQLAARVLQKVRPSAEGDARTAEATYRAAQQDRQESGGRLGLVPGRESLRH